MQWTYHVNDLLKGEAEPDLQGVRLVSDGPLQGVVVVHTEQVVEEAFLMRSLHTTCNRTNHNTINTPEGQHINNSFHNV